VERCAHRPLVRGFARTAICALALVGFPVRPALAQEQPDGEGDIELHGFLLGGVAGRTTGVRPAGDRESDFLLAEERLRLDVGAWADSVEASLRVKGDFLHDAVDDECDLDLREAYVDYSEDALDLRLGRQTATWGVGDLVFINDVFPKDWVSFFSGRPLEYLKIGVDGLRARYSSAEMNAELIAIPFFTPDNVPTGERFFSFDPFPSDALREQDLPDSSYGNTELGLRLYRRTAGFDLSAYAYRGFWRWPSMEPDSFSAPTRVTSFYPALSVYGMSAQGGALGGVLSLEAGYYHSRDDEAGDDAVVPNSQVRSLIGYQRQLRQDALLGVQYYVEVMEDHDAYRAALPAGSPEQGEYRDLVTLRLEQQLEHQAWKLALMCFYSPADDDYLLQPQVSYKLSDEVMATVGANVLGGERAWTQFGQLDRNDAVYLVLRFDF